MSDPVTNMAIEDVLSSIRRLVSEGDRAGRSDIFAQPDPLPDPLAAPILRQNGPQPLAMAEKFVLSPAFRISEVPAAMPVPGQDMAAALLAAGAGPRDQSVLTRTVPQRPESRSALEQRIAELEAAVTEQSDDWEPDGSEDVPVVDWSSPEVGESLVFSSRAMPQPDRSGVLDLGKAGTRIHPVILEAEIAAEPATDAEPYDLGEDLDLSDAEPVPADIEHYLEDTGSIDEVALRKLVIDIVRQELQGPLGERITRNVRKMVRREIYRVLSSQEFES